MVHRAAGDLSLLAPGLGWRHLPGSTPPGQQAWLEARAAPTLDVTLTGTDNR
jgi:hypothetical protein